MKVKTAGFVYLDLLLRRRSLANLSDAMGAFTNKLPPSSLQPSRTITIHIPRLLSLSNDIRSTWRKSRQRTRRVNIPDPGR